VPVEPLAGKVVISTINYILQRDGRFPELDDGRPRWPGCCRRICPPAGSSGPSPCWARPTCSGDCRPERRALALAGDDPSAKQLVARLYDELGFDPVDIGGLDQSWRVDVGQPAFVTRQNVAELEANVAKAKRGLDPGLIPMPDP
jgi:hypothetical protein